MKNCMICNKPLPKPENPKTHNFKYCNKKCRNKAHYLKFNTPEQQNERRQKMLLSKGIGLKRCLECEKWFVKPIAHAWQIHHMNEAEYKQKFDLPLSKGVIPVEHKELLHNLALENKMDEQLRKVGVRTRYKKNDPKAIMVTGWKGRNGNLGYRE